MATISVNVKKRGLLYGNEFESAIVSEIYKQLNTYPFPYHCYHLQTKDGRDANLLFENEDHFIAIEIKSLQRIDKSDYINFIGLENILNKPLKHVFILSNDNEVKRFGKNITSIHSTIFLA